MLRTAFLRSDPLATPNYSYEKRQRELAKKRKAEEKRQRKTNKSGEPGDATEPGSPAEGGAPTQPTSGDASKT
jgi:hypothetical protein